ncbi:hypothetical protein CFP71_14770 [Amycolatopsis thailandensis]|uniref:Uncharacterized protein n=1 Tax=Amycolatopsis thailandensis TaxID=589330 RepID=A0A229SBI0_9PSEU|nr:hypothetical protein [Amycolatopsis thailandensis]OXM56091.1 hypothetical protein CFP71_14770 [Amycolatopsis thailandensis]
MSPGVEIDADRIAAAVQARPHIAGLHSGRFGEIATLLRGRRIPGIRIRDDEITIGVTGRYPATAVEIGDDVRTAVGPVDRPVHVRIGDIAAPVALTADEPETVRDVTLSKENP